jgi:hypothetical protein
VADGWEGGRLWFMCGAFHEPYWNIGPVL